MKSLSSIHRLLMDVSGAFGDIGVLFPLAIALIARNGFNPTALFLCAGLFYIISAYYFRITMPVQPLKAMSALAISSGMGVDIINSAGLVMGLLLIGMSLSRVSVWLGALFPVAVIRGIQFALGIILVKTSFGLAQGDILMTVVGSALLGLTFLVSKKIPTLIPILILGMTMAAQKISVNGLGPIPISFSLPSFSNLWIGFVALVIPQIALTFGNAIVATEATSKLLYGEGASRLNLRSIPMSMGIANFLGSFFGAVPMCHGSGGLTAHSKFGSSSVRSGYIIGGFLICLALLFGKSAFQLISAFPSGLLAVLVLYVGVQHGAFIRDILRDKFSLTVAAITAFVGVATSNLSIGFVLGIAVFYGWPAIKRIGAIRLAPKP